MFKKTIICLLFFYLIFTSINPSVSSNQNFENSILYVGGTGEGNFSNIAEAVNSSNDGDTVFVYDGFYNGNVTIDKSIRIIGESNNFTIIEGNFSYYCFNIKDSNVNISNFLIKNSSIGISLFGSKIFNESKIFNNLFENNSAGIYIDGYYKNKISNNFFNNNSEDIRIYNSTDNIIENNNFMSTSTYGLVLMDNVSNNYIKYNYFSNKNSAIYTNKDSNNNYFLNNNFSNNGYGINFCFCKNLSILNNYFFNNSYGGIQLKNSEFINVTNNSLIQNVCGIRIDKSVNYSDLSLNYFFDNNEDIKIIGSPPKIKIPSLEMSLLIIFVFISLIIFYFFTIKKKN